MSSVIMRLWLKRRDKLIHSYSLVGYLLSPNPAIMAHVNNNRSEIHQKAVVSLIKRLILFPLLVGADRTRCLEEAVNTFWVEFACFTTKKKMLCLPYMWEKTQ
jgi:hypothetical protein